MYQFNHFLGRIVKNKESARPDLWTTQIFASP